MLLLYGRTSRKWTSPTFNFQLYSTLFTALTLTSCKLREQAAQKSTDMSFQGSFNWLSAGIHLEEVR